MAQINANEQFALKMCVCRNCPSYVECREKVAFCFIGKSKCITEQNGCICGGCPVAEKMKFNRTYYCTEGSEKMKLKK